MDSFGKKLKEARDAKSFSQAELARQIGVHHSIIGKYERDEVKPTIDVVKKIAVVLNTTAGFLMGETKETNILKNPLMLNRLNDIEALPDNDKVNILYTIDGLVRDAKTRIAYK